MKQMFYLKQKKLLIHRGNLCVIIPSNMFGKNGKCNIINKKRDKAQLRKTKFVKKCDLF
jgi:hypothetical protein